MKLIKNRYLVGMFFLLFSLSTLADMFQPSPSCSKPITAYKHSAQWEIDNFNYAIERYEKCMKDFIEEQNKAIKLHQKALSEAMDNLNSIVSSEDN